MLLSGNNPTLNIQQKMLLLWGEFPSSVFYGFLCFAYIVLSAKYCASFFHSSSKLVWSGAFLLVNVSAPSYISVTVFHGLSMLSIAIYEILGRPSHILLALTKNN